MSSTLIIKINILQDNASHLQEIFHGCSMIFLLLALELLQSQESKSFTLSGVHSPYPLPSSLPRFSLSHTHTPHTLVTLLCCSTSFSTFFCYSTDPCTMQHSLFVTSNWECFPYRLLASEGLWLDSSLLRCCLPCPIKMSTPRKTKGGLKGIHSSLFVNACVSPGVTCLHDFAGEGAVQVLSTWVIFLFSHIPDLTLPNSRPTLEGGRTVIDWEGTQGNFLGGWECSVSLIEVWVSICVKLYS